jgi:transcription elongation factor Elf1
VIKESVFQRTIFICDQCGKEKSVETELEKYEGQYEEISEFMPDNFHEIEELDIILCDNCFKKLKAQFGKIN